MSPRLRRIHVTTAWNIILCILYKLAVRYKKLHISKFSSTLYGPPGPVLWSMSMKTQAVYFILQYCTVRRGWFLLCQYCWLSNALVLTVIVL